MGILISFLGINSVMGNKKYIVIVKGRGRTLRGGNCKGKHNCEKARRQTYKVYECT